MIGFLLILGGCVALLWWAVRASQRQKQQEYDTHPTTSGAGRPATDRQLDYIESLLDLAEMTLNEASRDALGRSVSMDSLLTIDEASDLIDYLKELPGDRQSTTLTAGANRAGAAPPPTPGGTSPPAGPAHLRAGR